MLVGLKQILNMAQQQEYCIPAFNVYNLETAKGVINAAEQLGSPVILQFYSRLVTSKVAEDVAPIVLDLATKARVPVCFHLDHGAGECEVVRALRMGMTGIMIDASKEDLQTNIATSKNVVKLCDYVDVAVEGELGYVGKAVDGVSTDYTTVEDAKAYVEGTGVSALAVAVGTAHGRYQQAPVLQIERIREIKQAVGIPLVLHGGSGVPDEQIKMAIKAGIRKMNFSTDLCYSFLDACRERDKSIVGIDLFMAEPIQRVEEFAKSKITVLGASGRV